MQWEYKADSLLLQLTCLSSSAVSASTSTTLTRYTVHARCASLSSSLLSNYSSSNQFPSSSSSLSRPKNILILSMQTYCLPLMWYGGRIPSTSLLLRALTTGNSCVHQIYAIITTHTTLYLAMFFPVWWALNDFSLVWLPNSRRLMYIMSGMPITLGLEACCARHIAMHTTQHTSNNARSLCVSFTTIANNQSRFSPCKCRAHPARFSRSLKSYRSVTASMAALFFSSSLIFLLAGSWLGSTTSQFDQALRKALVDPTS
jgi:hypothetical protein